MATTTRSKHKQIERRNLSQENESDNDPDFSSSESEESDQTVSDSGVINITDDEEETNIERFSPEKRKPPSKSTRPRTSWIWKFFKETEDKTKIICQIEGCGKVFVWCGFPSSMKTHLSGMHYITKGNAASYLEVLQAGDQQLVDSIIEEEHVKTHPYTKQEALTNNVIGFVIGTVQPLSIVEDKDFIKMLYGFDSRYKSPCTKTLKD
jgi:hypothetical protein